MFDNNVELRSEVSKCHSGTGFSLHEPLFRKSFTVFECKHTTDGSYKAKKRQKLFTTTL